MKNILIYNPGGLGDVFLTTHMIPAIKQAYPDCTIGMLVTPQAKVVVEGLVDAIHAHEPWLRPGEPLLIKLKRFVQFLFQRSKIAKELAHYNCVLNTYPFFAGMGSVFHMAKIPHIGFETIGERHFLTQSIPWVNGEYLAEHYKRMLQAIGIEPNPFQSPWIAQEICKGKDIIFHIGSTNLAKDLPVAFWKTLYTSLKAEGYQITFTGKGDEQRRFIEQITGHHNEQSWPQFIQAIHQSALLISVDTVAVHLAAAMKKPFIVLYKSTPDIPLWFPKGGTYFNKEFKPEEIAEKALEIINESDH